MLIPCEERKLSSVSSPPLPAQRRPRPPSTKGNYHQREEQVSIQGLYRGFVEVCGVTGHQLESDDVIVNQRSNPTPAGH
jgi:hypothetical protein